MRTPHDNIVGCIELTKGYYAIVDAIDADLAELKWYVKFTTSKKTTYYVVQTTPKRYMHRVILERAIGRKLNKGEVCDHINTDTLDNRRCNLRVATHSQNHANTGKRPGGNNPYKGITKFRGKWKAAIRKDGKTIFLGVFEDPLEAHEAYCEAAKRLHGEFARFE